MAWAWQRNYVTLKSGERIRYGLYVSPDSPAYCVRFKDKDGRYVRLSTGQFKKPEAIDEAHQTIREHYEEIAPTSATVSWNVAKEKLKAAMMADKKRPKTIKGYEE